MDRAGGTRPSQTRDAIRPEAPLHFVEVVTGTVSSESPLPMIIGIHGLGDTPERFARLFEGFDRPARFIFFRGPEPTRNGGASWFDIDPSAYGPRDIAAGVDHSAARVAKRAEQLARQRPTLGKPIVTGFSQGGFLSFALAARHAEHFRLAAPIAGYLPWREAKGGGAKIPIRAFHGESDPIVSVDDARASIAHLEALGYDATLTVYPGVRHGVSPKMRAEIFELLAQAISRP